MRPHGIALAAVLALVPELAHADWEWTHWGMKREALEAAGQARGMTFSLHLDGDSEVELDATTRVWVWDLAGRYFIDRRGGLYMASFMQKDTAKCGAMYDMLVETHGKPLRREPLMDLGVRLKWRDEAARNEVEFAFIPDYWCRITYSVLTPW